MDEILIGLITNAPNLAGLVILAWVLDRRYGDLLKMYSELLNKYHELVVVLGDNKRITPAQIQQLLHPIEKEQGKTDKKL